MAVSTINAYATYNIIVKVSDGTDISTKSIRVIVVTDDADGDGITDEEEIADGLDPNDPTDADLDSDGDGISNKDEANNDCLDWTDSDDANADSDGDGISNKLEIAIGTDVCNPDTDGDGVPDGQDAFMYDETESVDSDGDNLGDTQEEAGIGLDDIQSAYENNTIIIDEDRTDSEKLALEECKLVVEKATTDAVLKWRWKVDKKTEPGSCTLKHDNMIQPFMFVVR